jgi:hypothetical protein
MIQVVDCISAISNTLSRGSLTLTSFVHFQGLRGTKRYLGEPSETNIQQVPNLRKTHESKLNFLRFSNQKC